MQVIRPSGDVSFPDNPGQRLFVQLWYSMVHRGSLDSHRVRCMDSLNITRELQTLFSKPPQKVETDIQRVAGEALQILSADRSLKKHFHSHFARIQPLLEHLAVKATRPNLIDYYLRDLVTDLEARYKSCILDDLELAIFHEGSDEKIRELTGVLLTRLVDEGQTLESLFNIGRYILLGRDDAFTEFRERFSRLRSVVTRQPSNHSLVFRLSGFHKPGEALPQLPGLKLRPTWKTPPDCSIPEHAEQRVKEFLSPDTHAFATIQITAWDDRAAGRSGRSRLESALDLLRFEREAGPIVVDNHFLSIRESDSIARVYEIPRAIPNPTRRVRLADFHQFVADTTGVLQSQILDGPSREKIRSALRFYRMGRDAAESTNKLVNWWTALEYLVRTGGQGSIGDVVITRLAPILTLHYLPKHLEDARETMGRFAIDPHQSTQDQYGVSAYAQLKVADLFDVLRSEKERNHIVKSLKQLQPAFVHILERLWNGISDPPNLLSLLSGHQQRVEWHIHRIYRGRCDIVHSALPGSHSAVC